MRFLTASILPVEASEHATRVDYLFYSLLAVSIGIVILLTFLITYCIIRYRAGSSADRTPLKIDSRKLEITWTILPGLIFIGIFAWGAKLYIEGDQSAPRSDTVYILARQWMWETRYPDGRREHNRLHLPIGRPIQLLMTSEDVIHSLYLPSMRMKQDVLPGKYVSLSFTPDKVGTFPFYCAEYCGTKHSAMIGEVIVMAPQDYQKWLTEGNQNQSLAKQGGKLFAEMGCAGCHFPGSSVHAPLLEGIYGKNIPLDSGEFVTADETYIRDSILLPLKQIAAGYEPLMPTYESQLNESQVMALIEYIKSMKNDAGSSHLELRPNPPGTKSANPDP
ncbi:cytochrome c oxidase subunit II [Luteolibacter pohnpeiensis]|uniref:Cytochrome c oxidase subunit 2 n=1 Tax=Luteolibacter pohnpeiensis TaxID=454153 RepID=A0A934S556_9BACT|nr:cytochrome c oxidase subunit II [Luteolibacter pohnpeiensis]MBK1882073.1 cytochrome c oxidase subunit II [Luteolibacter pohnpeiensis]